jgi:hypothetical protein
MGEFDWQAWGERGRWMAIGRPRCSASGCGGERRRTAGAAARSGPGARVLRLTRGLHRDDDECLANPLATLPGGDGEGRRRAASNRGGGAPARRPWRGGARGRLQAVPAASLPRGGSTEQLRGERTTAAARARGGGAVRGGGGADEVGLGTADAGHGLGRCRGPTAP